MNLVVSHTGACDDKWRQLRGWDGKSRSDALYEELCKPCTSIKPYSVVDSLAFSWPFYAQHGEEHQFFLS